MNLALLAPAALAWLAALALPLLIHLARRSELRPVEFAALRWLRAGQRPRRHLRMDNWPLLALRLLLLALLALWLARPVLQAAADDAPYVAVMPGITAQQAQAQPLPDNARLHWLAEGFAPLAEKMPAAPQPLTSLLRQLDAELPQDVPLTVLVTARFDGADAERPALSRPVDWRVLDVDPPAVAPARRTPPPALRIHSDEAHAGAARYLRAAAMAWQMRNTADAVRRLDAPPPSDTSTALAWLGSGDLPVEVQQWVEAGGTALLAADTTPLAEGWTVAWRDETGQALLEVRAAGKGRMLRFPMPLQPRAMPVLLEADFPQRLLAVLQPERPAPARADARALIPSQGAARLPLAAHDLQPWFALLIALAFAAERWMAAGPRRRAAA